MCRAVMKLETESICRQSESCVDCRQLPATTHQMGIQFSLMTRGRQGKSDCATTLKKMKLGGCYVYKIHVASA